MDILQTRLQWFPKLLLNCFAMRLNHLSGGCSKNEEILLFSFGFLQFYTSQFAWKTWKETLLMNLHTLPVNSHPPPQCFSEINTHHWHSYSLGQHSLYLCGDAKISAEIWAADSHWSTPQPNEPYWFFLTVSPGSRGMPTYRWSRKLALRPRPSTV